MVDRVINALKWPAALLSVVLLPSTLWASLLVLRRVVAAPDAIAPAAAGAAVCGLVLWLLSRVPLRGVWLATLEHELTHALFAVATGHRVVGLRTTWRRGGMITITGAPGNWLITLAPYFFPTTCVAAGAVWLLLPPSARHLGSVLLGAALAYHLWSTVRETHAQQPDLRQAGWLFSLLLLPTANLWAVFTVLACAHGGWRGGVEFCREALDVAWVWA
jgi:hypothetical protein